LTATHRFTLILDGADVMDAAHMNALYEAGLGDALVGRGGGVQHADFEREAGSFREAVLGAIAATEGAVPGLRVIRLEPDDLVTATVIAERTGRTRESVRLLIAGERGPGGFPAPISWVDAKTRVWHWSDVARWFAAAGRPTRDEDVSAFVAAVNAALELRRHAGALSSQERATLARIAGGRLLTA
jgi:hypothetical protein